MQAFGRLRFEHCARQQGREETPLELRLEQLLELREERQQNDAEVERKEIAAEQKMAGEERRQQIAIWCAQAIESAERRQDVEQQSAVLRRRQDDRGRREAPGGRSTHERAREEWQQVVRSMNRLVRSGGSASTPAVGPASSCWPGSSLDRNAQRGEVQKQQAEAADLVALDATQREQAEAADVWL